MDKKELRELKNILLILVGNQFDQLEIQVANSDVEIDEATLRGIKQRKILYLATLHMLTLETMAEEKANTFSARIEDPTDLESIINDWINGGDNEEGEPNDE